MNFLRNRPCTSNRILPSKTRLIASVAVIVIAMLPAYSGVATAETIKKNGPNRFSFSISDEAARAGAVAPVSSAQLGAIRNNKPNPFAHQTGLQKQQRSLEISRMQQHQFKTMELRQQQLNTFERLQNVQQQQGSLQTFRTQEQRQLRNADAQLANVDLQNVLQKQQQILQMMSNISKMTHDTNTSVIRKIGG